MSKKLLFIAACCMSLYQPIQGAEVQKVSLDIHRVLELVEQNNKDVATARKKVDVSEQGVKVANTALLPDISASLSANYLGDILLMDRDFDHSFRAEMPHFGNGISLTLYQPIYTGGAITAGVQLAQSQSSLSKMGMEQTRQSIGMQAIGCYLELFKANNLQNVYDENIAITNRLLNEMKARQKEGVVLKNDITRYELRLSTLNYDRLTIHNRIAILNHDLCLLLGLPEDSEIETNISDELSHLPEMSSKEKWLNEAMDNALSLKMLDIQQSMNQQQRKLLNAERLPVVGIAAGDTFEGPVTFEIPVIDKNYNFWFIGLNVKYNFSSLFKTPKSLVKNTFEKEELATSREAVSNRLNQAIHDTHTQYTQAFRMLETEEKNVELATENYRIVENRYNNQLALLTDMLDASTAKLDADVRLINARVNIIYYYYQLKYNSGTL
jgi:outer membrane protein TolC